MPILAVPRPLEEQLGIEATNGLVEVLNEVEKAAKEDVILIAEQKYERRLTEEMARLRSQDLPKLDKRITDEMAKLRSEDLPKLDKRITEETAKLDKRITDEMAKLRSEDLPKLDKRISEETAKLDKRITEEIAKLEKAIATSKVDMIKWMVGLFVAQIGILTAIMALLLR